MSVGRICVREVDLADAQEPVQAAAQRMHSRKVGTLVVLNAKKEPIGIITDRDLAVRVVAAGKDAFETTVEDVMTRSPQTVRVDATIEDALTIMRGRTIRRLPVVDREQHLVGLISLDDILSLLTEEFNEIGGLLQEESPSSLAL